MAWLIGISSPTATDAQSSTIFPAPREQPISPNKYPCSLSVIILVVTLAASHVLTHRLAHASSSSTPIIPRTMPFILCLDSSNLGLTYTFSRACTRLRGSPCETRIRRTNRAGIVGVKLQNTHVICVLKLCPLPRSLSMQQPLQMRTTGRTIGRCDTERSATWKVAFATHGSKPTAPCRMARRTRQLWCRNVVVMVTVGSRRRPTPAASRPNSRSRTDLHVQRTSLMLGNVVPGEKYF